MSTYASCWFIAFVGFPCTFERALREMYWLSYSAMGACLTMRQRCWYLFEKGEAVLKWSQLINGRTVRVSVPRVSVASLIRDLVATRRGFQNVFVSPCRAALAYWS